MRVAFAGFAWWGRGREIWGDHHHVGKSSSSAVLETHRFLVSCRGSHWHSGRVVCVQAQQRMMSQEITGHQELKEHRGKFLIPRLIPAGEMLSDGFIVCS